MTPVRFVLVMYVRYCMSGKELDEVK